MSPELAGLIDEAVSVSRNVENAFGALSGQQLNWKPSPSAWSIAQCLEHLIITNELEFPAIREASRVDYRNPLWSRMPFLPQFFGRLMIWLFATASSPRVKTPKMFRPSQSDLPKDIVEIFLSHQREVIELFEQGRHLDLHRTKIVSPVSNVVTYSLFDAYRVLVGHEQRHFRQAARVLQFGGFPR